MVISHSNKFIFIHIYKVAGTSISKVLSHYTKLNLTHRIKVKSGFFKYIIKDFPDHIKAYELKKQLPKSVYNNYFKFAFVRNPWDWQVSLYQYMLEYEPHPQHQLVKGFDSFDKYIEWRVNDALVLQKDFLYENEYEIVDFIGRYENLTNDFNLLCKKLGINESLPHLNKSKHDEYKLYYSPYSRNLIKQAFAEDIRLFNYSF